MVGAEREKTDKKIIFIAFPFELNSVILPYRYHITTERRIGCINSIYIGFTHLCGPSTKYIVSHQITDQLWYKSSETVRGRETTQWTQS